MINTLEELYETFEEFHESGESFNFERIEKPPYIAPDLCAFMYLYNIVKFKPMVGYASRDEIWIGVNVERSLLGKITKDDVLYLVRCGVSYDSNSASLFMFV